MTFANLETGGSQVAGPERRKRLTDDEIRRLRASYIYAHRLHGWTTREIANYYSLSPQHINREIRAIPPTAKKIIARKYRSGEISLA